MNPKVDLGYAINDWRKALDKIKRQDIRIDNDDEEKKFWKRYVGRHIENEGFNVEKFEANIDDYSGKIREKVLEILKDFKIETTLEIGPGWGNYTFDLAGLSREMTCLDLSSDNLEYIKTVADLKNIKNIKYINKKVEEANIDSYDLIFGYNCFYRMYDLDKILEEIDKKSKKIAMIGMATGVEPKYNNLFEEKLNLPMDWRENDYIYLTMILYSKGVDINQIVIKNKRKYTFDGIESILKHESVRIDYKTLPLDLFSKNKTKEEEKLYSEVKDILLQYYKYEDGKYVYEYEFNSMLLYWTK